MKPRPPTLREPRRYLLIRVTPLNAACDWRELAAAIDEALSSLFGDGIASRVHPAVVHVSGEFAIIRCRRGCERVIETALATVCSVGDSRACLHPLSTSGTIRSLRERITAPEVQPGLVPAETTFNGERMLISRRYGRRLDLIGKGFTSTDLFFVTEEDIEEI